MNALFLESSLCLTVTDDDGNKTFQKFPNNNKVIDNFKKYIKKYDNFLFIASGEDEIITDAYARMTFASFNATLPFANYKILDHRNADNANELVSHADFIYLAGGHVPTQLKLFNKLKLKKYVMKTNAVICGNSAGSMNSASTVYCAPELLGEETDSAFDRYPQGLGLTNVSIFPHWNRDLTETSFLGEKNLYFDILLPDGKRRPFLAYNDGTYVIQAEGKITVHGEAYLFSGGACTKICDADKIADVTKIFAK